MKFDPDRHRRRSIRLKGYDYSSLGYYYVTLCTAGRICLFGDIRDGEMVLNPLGEIVSSEWQASANIRREIVLDVFVVMPNHLHGIVAIVSVGADGVRPAAPTQSLGPRPRSLPTMISGFKSATTRRINTHRGTDSGVVWQRNYYEEVVANERHYEAICQYIIHNPRQWELDRDNPDIQS